jgi:hypothetical protein
MATVVPTAMPIGNGGRGSNGDEDSRASKDFSITFH